MALNYIETKSKNKFSRRDLLIVFSAIVVIAINFIFPVRSVGESFFATIFLFLVFPLLVVKFVLGESLQNFGLSPGNFRVGVIYAVAAAVLLALAQYFLIYKFNFFSQYKIVPGISTSFAYFLWFELVVVSIINFCWGFFFRGFLQLGLEEKWGIYSLFLAAIGNSLLFVKEFWFTPLLIFVMALAAGWITLKSRSIYYSAISMWLISIATDIMLIKIILKG